MPVASLQIRLHGLRRRAETGNRGDVFRARAASALLPATMHYGRGIVQFIARDDQRAHAFRSTKLVRRHADQIGPQRADTSKGTRPTD